MATPIKRIEKDFLLKVLYDEQLPVLLRHARVEYTLHVGEPPKREVHLRCDIPVANVTPGLKLEFFFDYRGQTVSFVASVASQKENLLVVEGPEFLYKNLSRSYSRVTVPQDLRVLFAFRGERYDLSLPRIEAFEPATEPQYSELFDPKDIRELTSQLGVFAADTASGHKLVMFKDKHPETFEERLISQTGKVLLIPSTAGGIPSMDPSPQPRLVTVDIMKRYLENTGSDPVTMEQEIEQFVAKKKDAHIYSDLWCPIPFQEYVVGYIHLWIDEEGKSPFDHSSVETMIQFAKVLAYSLHIHGYFKGHLRKNEAFLAKVIDVSASGILFANPSTSLATALLPQSEIEVRLETSKRSVRASAVIIRRYRDFSTHYFGCRYSNIAPEDLRFLFEYLYGRPFTDTEGLLGLTKA